MPIQQSYRIKLLIIVLASLMPIRQWRTPAQIVVQLIKLLHRIPVQVITKHMVIQIRHIQLIILPHLIILRRYPTLLIPLTIVQPITQQPTLISHNQTPCKCGIFR